jgi:phosphomannomutase
VLGLAAELKAAGRTFADRLDEIAMRYGAHETDQLAVRVTDLDRITAAMARLRADPPVELDGEPVEVIDVAPGTNELPPTDAVLITGESVKVVVRPSGTEPKLKCYLEARRPPDSSIPPAQERRLARARLARIRSEMSVALGLGPD